MSRTPNSAFAFTKLHFVTASPQHRGAFRVLCVDKYSDAPPKQTREFRYFRERKCDYGARKSPLLPAFGTAPAGPAFWTYRRSSRVVAAVRCVAAVRKTTGARMSREGELDLNVYLKSAFVHCCEWKRVLRVCFFYVI